MTSDAPMELIDPGFVHLRLHSEYSLLRGAMRLSKLAKLAEEAGQPAVALTDTNNLFGALEFAERLSGAGVQPIMGMEVELAVPGLEPAKRGYTPPCSVVVLVQNEAGWHNLLKLHSAQYVDPDREAQGLTVAELAHHNDGLILLTGAAYGPVGQILARKGEEAASALLDHLHAAYGDRLYIELQRHPGAGALTEAQELTEPFFISQAYERALPLVATNDVHFPNAEMNEAHDAMLCIGTSSYVDQAEPRLRLSDQHYFKSAAEMASLFADLPEALAMSVEIAQRCAFRPKTHAPILPRFADDEVEELRRQAREGLQARLDFYDETGVEPADTAETYAKRLDYELSIIERMGFPGYFLIVADFIKWAKQRDIPVGPGRGSGAGSLVAWALTITDLDPLRYGLLFERFLNPDRVSMPDFDIDFCMDRREEVISYVQEKYGRDRVAQIITFGALLSKMAVRDVGRVLQMPYGQTDRLAKLIPVEGVKPVPIAQALKDEPRLAEEAQREEVVARLLDYGQKVEGLLRNASTHAAGVVIGDRPLDELVPLYRDPKSDMPASGWNMGWSEAAGLVKFDFLGLKTLTVIKTALDFLAQAGTHVDIDKISLEDETSFELYQQGRTVAVFQVESAGMIDALRRMKPTCIEDIVALVALYRPGPMENIPKYCEVKNGLSKREALHPLIDHILDETQGIIVYQEQVMQIAQEMAGYSLGGADLLRRAMGKKKKEAMDAERPKFIAGAAEKGVDEAKAVEIWNLLEKFANYGFNKSHAAAYALVSYQTAWLKANHPASFMAAVMQCDIHLTDKLAVYAEEVKKPAKRGGLGLEIGAPCVNRSEAGFSVEGTTVRYALGALKNVGIEAMRLITRARGDQPFTSIFDFARRVDLKAVGKRGLEMLARGGAFDALIRNRAQVFNSLDALVAYSAAVHEQRHSSQSSLFGEAGEDLPEPPLARVQEWPAVQRLAEEHTAIGFYLSGHPLDDYVGALKRKSVMSFDEAAAKASISGAHMAWLAGVVVARQERKSARGNRFAFLGLSDVTAQFEATLFSDLLEETRHLLEAGKLVVMQAQVDPGEGEGGAPKLLGRKIIPLEDFVADAPAAGLNIWIEDASAVPAAAAVLDAARKAAKLRSKRAKVRMRLMAADLPNGVQLELGEDFVVGPEVQAALKNLQGVATVLEE